MSDKLGGPDRAVLEELAKRGDVAAIPREVTIWIYGTKADLDAVAERLTCTWNAAVPIQDKGKWSIMACRMQEATEIAILAMSDEIEAALVGTEAEYDGWETSIKLGN